ncbi:BadF/BadG/BcrA/BcrD ATPase family protein [Stakelama tenebrarum]|uniref:ATPase n=1 Tax=Stakelama tenebrarum TaxID=2711215 RepID=A0A6G6Y5H2_9SPHN|nr:BadF/BadG/BcrA/BcrD ATPase family protein [Sphingosinithalassobacter tenebrarum]QIG80182.1 ATPase [Sphingosinithalassobacter tenebrarum]
MMAYYLGIDAGGSNCRARLAAEDGTVLGTGSGGSANTRIGFPELYATLSETAYQAIRQARLDDTQIAEVHAGIGVAGYGRQGASEALRAFDFPFASVAYETDAYIANLGANGRAEGAVLIIGTGSVAHVRKDGRSFTIGGYGFPISDEGSGAALGLSAVRHALRALDGRTKSTPLSSAVTARFDHDTASVVGWMDEATPRDYASFAPVVMDYAEADDAIARSIVEDAAQHIERFIETIFQRGANRCALVGGLSQRMRPWLRERTVSRLSDALGDPLDGAIDLAKRG